VADLFAIAADQGVFLMEAMWMKFSPGFRRLHAELAGGTIGEARNLQAGFSIPFPDDGGSKWDVDRSGGALLDQGIYPLTLAHSIFGAPTSITATGTVRPDGLDISEHITLEFGDGRFAQCAVSMAEFGDCAASVGGRQGWLTLTAPFWATTEVRIHARSFEQIFRTPEVVSSPREGNGYVPMVREVIDAIADGRTEHPVHTAEDTIAVFEIVDAVFSQIRRSPQH
jgi:predicted dehydrogenase